VDTDAADSMIDLIRKELVAGDGSNIPNDDSGIKLVGGEEFS
jgi:hypothetical protein